MMYLTTGIKQTSSPKNTQPQETAAAGLSYGSSTSLYTCTTRLPFHQASRPTDNHLPAPILLRIERRLLLLQVLLPLIKTTPRRRGDAPQGYGTFTHQCSQVFNRTHHSCLCTCLSTLLLLHTPLASVEHEITNKPKDKEPALR